MLRAPSGGTLELAVRRALNSYSGDLDVVITPAMDAAHAEIVISENGVWRAACYATLSAAENDQVQKIRDAFQAGMAASADLTTSVTGDPSRTS
jgi:hypothetical protein